MVRVVGSLPASKSLARRNFSMTSAPMLRGDNVFARRTTGELIIARLNGGAYDEIRRAPQLEPTFPMSGTKFVWTPPAYANRCVFARNDGELVCASLAE